MRFVNSAIVVGALFAVSCGASKPEVSEPQSGSSATALLNPTEGNVVSGSVTFTQVDGNVHVHAEITGLTPGKHGFHVHEVGDCSDPAGKSAGGHFNPDEMDHGGPHDAIRHVGDLGNLEADDGGKAVLDTDDSLVALDGPNTVIGRSVIVHADADDLTSQPTGAAGARVACGVIKAD
ncbi:MAG: superoxide dismutase family protein [Deltaproteobacteria bacterium]|nr:superoxide dismutase family protein [Deltaproteobacteria bacterium]